MQLVEKVIAYITDHGHLLVFEQPDFPGAGIQVPGGTVEPGETPRQAVLREAYEETGLEGFEIVRFLGTRLYTPNPGRERRRHFFHLVLRGRAPEVWDNWEKTPHSGHPPVLFRLRWVPFGGVPPLSRERGALLEELQASASTDGTLSP